MDGLGSFCDASGVTVCRELNETLLVWWFGETGTLMRTWLRHWVYACLDIEAELPGALDS